MTDDGQRTASPAQVDVHWLVKTSQRPQPLVNAAVLGCVADLLWPAQRLIVEVDLQPLARRPVGPPRRPPPPGRPGGRRLCGLRVRRSDPAHQTLQRLGHGLAARSLDRPR